MSRSAVTMLEPGHDAEWRRLGAEKKALLTPAPDTAVGDLLRRGQRLSAQAARLVRAVQRGSAPSAGAPASTIAAAAMVELRMEGLEFKALPGENARSGSLDSGG